MQSARVLLVTADRREAAFGIFGGDSEEHLKEAFSDMARDLAKFVARTLAAGAPQPVPVAATTTGAPATAAPKVVVGTWRGTLRLPGRTPSDGALISPATLRVVEQGGLMQWSLTSHQAGGEVRGAGTAELSGDTLRLSGSYDQSSAPSGLRQGGLPRVPIVYSGTVSADAFEATGLTGDNKVHVLSVRRVAP
jgi:hypothetical protein